MEHIPNYDNWKTTPPDDPEPVTHCNICGKDMYEGDVVYKIDGGICLDCLDDNYRSFV